MSMLKRSDLAKRTEFSMRAVPATGAEVFLDAGGEADTVICPGIGAARKSSSGIQIVLDAIAVQ
jgi:hypothetical protein